MLRLTNRVFTDLAIWMSAIGLLVGFIFPPFCVFVGLPADQVMTERFYAASVLAGLAVGGVNFALVRVVVGRRLTRLAEHMTRVESQLTEATLSGDWSSCDPLECALPIDSVDEVGASAAAFNSLIDTLARTHAIDAATRNFTAVVSSHLDLESLGREALAAVLNDTGATAGLLLVEREAGLEPLSSVGISQPELVAGNKHVAEALRTGRSQLLDIELEHVVIDSVLVQQDAEQVAIVPLAFKDVPLGALVLASVKPFSRDVRILVQHFQPDLGLALSNALSHDRLQRLAALDPLTDVYNRRFGLVRLQEEFGRALRVSGPLGVLMLDLDHFKTVNDTFGHLVGDRLLRATAASMRRSSREGDVLMRYGGEEFLMVVPGAAAGDLRDLAERIRRAVAATELMDGDRRVTVTASIGGASYPEHDVASASELVEAADNSLYAAKQSGRDRVVLAQAGTQRATAASGNQAGARLLPAARG